MRKFSFLLIALSVISIYTKAQATIGSAVYNKTTQTAVLIDYPFEPSITEDAISAKLKTLGYMGKYSKDFKVFKSVRLSELGSDTYDMYFMFGRKSKNKGQCSVTLLLSHGYDNFVSDSADANLLSNAKVYLDSLLPVIVSADLEKQIADQEDVVKKAEKKYNSAVDNGNDLEKRKLKLEQDIEDNKKDQASKKAEAAAQNQALANLKAKRK